MSRRTLTGHLSVPLKFKRAAPNFLLLPDRRRGRAGPYLSLGRSRIMGDLDSFQTGRRERLTSSRVRVPENSVSVPHIISSNSLESPRWSKSEDDPICACVDKHICDEEQPKERPFNSGVPSVLLRLSFTRIRYLGTSLGVVRLILVSRLLKSLGCADSFDRPHLLGFECRTNGGLLLVGFLVWDLPIVESVQSSRC